MNLIQKIIEEALVDDDSDYQSELILELYQNAPPEEQRAINELLVCICGWEMKSLIKMTESPEHS